MIHVLFLTCRKSVERSYGIYKKLPFNYKIRYSINDRVIEVYNLCLGLKHMSKNFLHLGRAKFAFQLSPPVIFFLTSVTFAPGIT